MKWKLSQSDTGTIASLPEEFRPLRTCLGPFQRINNFSLLDERTPGINYNVSCMEKILPSVCLKIYENSLEVS